MGWEPENYWRGVQLGGNRERPPPVFDGAGMWLIRCLVGNFRSLTLRLRYKEPEAGASKELEFPVADGGQSLEDASGDVRFAAAVAAFGMLLRNSEYND